MLKYHITLIIITSLITYKCSNITSVVRYNSNRNVEQNQSEIKFTAKDDTSIYEVYEEISEEFDPSEIPDDTTQYDLFELLKQVKSNLSNNNSTEVNQIEVFVMEIIKYMRTPYKFGGNSLDGIDCSGFTKSVYQNVLNINLNRSAREQFQQGEIINDRSQLKFGDLVFFNTRRKVRPGHVGIYLWDNYFVHANIKRGVTISSLEEGFYNKRYMGARRIKQDGFEFRDTK